MAMASSLSIDDDDKDLDDAALWAVIDSAAAASYTSSSSTITTTSTTTKFPKPQTLKTPPNQRTSPHVLLPPSPSPPSSHHKTRHYSTFNGSNGSARANSIGSFNRPQKMARSEISPELAVVKRVPVMPVYSSPESGMHSVKDLSPLSEKNSPQFDYRRCDDKEEKFTHCLAGRFPTVSLFKDYQDAAMELLEKSDYTMISGSPFIKKSGWRKIAFYFNVSFEIRDKDIEFDENRNVQRAEFVVRAYMQGGRFSDGWGSCERREKRFIKPNNDIPSTAETRAKNKACQDLLGIGAYRPNVSHGHSPR